MTRERAAELLSKVTVLDDPEMAEAHRAAISALRQQDVTDKDVGKSEPLTNAQKIRSMTDEDLAWELMLWRCEAVARHHGISSEYPHTQKTILEWLQQPAEEDGHDA